MQAQLITPYYEQDHDRLDGLFKQFQALKDTDFPKARDGFREFKAGLERHIAWEEEILFPRFEAKTGMKETGPTEVMRIEHGEIKRLLGMIHKKVELQDRATDLEEAALVSVLTAHNEKEERILYPALDSMLNEAEHGEVFAAMDRVGGKQPGVCSCGQARGPEETVVDVRELAPPKRHPLIMRSFADLQPDESFILVNDHDPKPLYYQFKYEHEGQFGWEYLEQGPEVWRVRISKTNAKA